MESLTAIIVTVVSGVLVYLFGEILNEIWLQPLQQYKEIKKRVATQLAFYGREIYDQEDLAQISTEQAKQRGKVADELRMLSCELFGFIERLSWIKIGIPKKKDLYNAAEKLMGISNNLFTPYGKAEPILPNDTYINSIKSSLKLYRYKARK